MRTDKRAGHNRAKDQAAAAERRTQLVKEFMEAERTAFDARSTKLRALRLAKEEGDREAARVEALTAGPVLPSTKKGPRVVANASRIGNSEASRPQDLMGAEVDASDQDKSQ